MHDQQGRIHDSISHVCWAGTLMEIRSLFGLNSAVEKTRDKTTDRPTNQPTDQPTNRPTNQPTNQSIPL